jgi:hypothetical protein
MVQQHLAKLYVNRQKLATFITSQLIAWQNYESD